MRHFVKWCYSSDSFSCCLGFSRGGVGSLLSPSESPELGPWGRQDEGGGPRASFSSSPRWACWPGACWNHLVPVSTNLVASAAGWGLSGKRSQGFRYSGGWNQPCWQGTWHTSPAQIHQAVMGGGAGLCVCETLGAVQGGHLRLSLGAGAGGMG